MNPFAGSSAVAAGVNSPAANSANMGRRIGMEANPGGEATDPRLRSGQEW